MWYTAIENSLKALVRGLAHSWRWAGEGHDVIGLEFSPDAPDADCLAKGGGYATPLRVTPEPGLHPKASVQGPMSAFGQITSA